jgi:threonine dehydrogenase-like Zn-dependent dehydrogenase
VKATTVEPGTRSVRLEEVPEPDPALGSVLVETLAVGVCGTDAEIANGAYRWAPPGRDRLILGHESLGRVLDPGPSGFDVGEHVVGVVRRPDPTRRRARTAPSVNGTCAPTVATPSGASSRSLPRQTRHDWNGW